jgi:hypothetical protein
VKLTRIRGAARIVAAVTSCVLLYGAVYALEAMTTRVPVSQAHSLASFLLYSFPFALLALAGVRDLVSSRFSFALAAILLTALFAFLNWFTSDFLTTRILGPIATIALASTLLNFRPLRWLAGAMSLISAVGGIGLAVYILRMTGRWATRAIELQVWAFILSSVLAGVLSLKRENVLPERLK